MIFNDEVGKMVDGIKSLATPLQDLILREAMTDREYANKAAAELLALRADLADAKARAAAEEARIAKIETTAKELINVLTDGEIEIARESWGNTNTRLVSECRRALEAALKSQ